MIELRPLLVPGDAPLVLHRTARPARDTPVRPLLRGLLLMGMLVGTGVLPALGSRLAGPIGGGIRRQVAFPGTVPPKRTARVATLRASLR